MTRIFPPVLTLGVTSDTFQLSVYPEISGAVYRLSDISMADVAEVTVDGLVTPNGVGQVFIDYTLANEVLSTCKVEIINSILPKSSHIIDDNARFDPYYKEQTLDQGDNLFIYPTVVYSDTSRITAAKSNYTILVSRDGNEFYNLLESETLVPEIKITSQNSQGRFAYKILGIHARTEPFVVRVIFTEGERSLTQDIYLKVTGPVAVNYEPYYNTNGFEIDLGTTLDINSTVSYNDGRADSSLVSYSSLTPDVISVDSNGTVTPIRVTDISYPSYSNTKSKVWSFCKARNKNYVSARNKIYEFTHDSQYGYGEVLFQLDNNINIRSLSSLQDVVLYFYISVKKQDKEPPKSVVYRVYVNRPILQPVGKVTQEGTAFCLSEAKDGSYRCILATRKDNLTYVYNFSHSNENADIAQYALRIDPVIVKAVPLAKDWVAFLDSSGVVYRYNLTLGTLSPLITGYSGIKSISSELYQESAKKQIHRLWVYQKNGSEVKLYRQDLEFSKTSVTDAPVASNLVDYGTLDTPNGADYLHKADLVESRHHLVFTHLPPDDSYADPPPSNPAYHGLSIDIEPQYFNESTDFINDHVGILDLSNEIVGKIKISSTEDPFINSTAEFKVNPSNTKHPYALKYSGGPLNLPTSTDNIVPVQAVLSDGTLVSTVSSLSGPNTFISGGYLYTREENEIKSTLSLTYSGNTALGLSVEANFYHRPVSVGIGNISTPSPLIKVKEGSSLEIPTYIFISGNRQYDKALKFSSDSNNIVSYETSGTFILLSGLSSGVHIINYETPQPITPVLSGTITVQVNPLAAPYRIDIPDIIGGTLKVPYRPVDLLHPEPFSYPVTISGQVIYSDGTALPYNSGIVWVVTSGSANYSCSGSTFYFTPPLSGPNPAGRAVAISESDPTVQREFILSALESQDTTPVRLEFPSYVTKYDNFIKFDSIPQKRINFFVRRANNTLVYGNSLATFTTSGNSIRVIENSLGTLAINPNSFDITTLDISVGDLTSSVFIQVAGPERIEPNLPFYQVDAGSTLSYVTGNIYDSNEALFTEADLVIKSSNPFEVSNSCSGTLRGKFTKYLPEPLSAPILWSSVSDEGTLSVLKEDGYLTYFDSNLSSKINKYYDYKNKKAYLFDLLRPDAGVIAFNDGNSTRLFINDGKTDFSDWGTLSGNVTDLCILKSRVYFTRQIGNSRQIGFIRRNAKKPKEGVTLDYATTIVSGISHPYRLSRSGLKLSCLDISGSVFLVDNNNATGFVPLQIFSGSSIGSPDFSINQDDLVSNLNQKNIGRIPENLYNLSVGSSFYFSDVLKTSVYRYTPTSVSSTSLVFTPEGFSTQTQAVRPITVLPSGTGIDYYLDFSIPDIDLIYIGDTRKVSANVYNSSGNKHSNVDVYVNGNKSLDTNVTFTQGGIAEIKVVSRNNQNVYAVKNIAINRRVSSVELKNFLEDDGAVSVNAESSVPLEVVVTYEDGYTDSNAELIITIENQNYISSHQINNLIYLDGINVTPGNATAAASLVALETQVTSSGYRSIPLQVKVYPAGTHKLSSVSLSPYYEIDEQGIASASASFYYTDGTSEPVFDEGFQLELSGLQTFETIKDLTVSYDNSLYVLLDNVIHVYTENGALSEVISLPENDYPFKKIRILDSNVYLSDAFRVFKLVDSDLNVVYGTVSGDSPSSVVDFHLSSSEILVLDVTVAGSKIVSIKGALPPESRSIAITDLSGFTVFDDGSVYLLSPSLGVISEDSQVISAVLNANGISNFSDELYVTLNHRIARILSNGTLDFIAGGVFPGLVNGNDPATVRFNTPTSIGINLSRQIYILDSGNKTVRRVTNNITTALIGNIWSSENSDIAYGTGDAIKAGKPGITKLTLKYLNTEKSTSVIVSPVYTHILFNNTDFNTILGPESKKNSIVLSADAYTLSGKASGSYVESINYPAPIVWACSVADFIYENILTPTKTGTCLVQASLQGIPYTQIRAVNQVSTVNWAATGLIFDQTAYYTPTNSVLDFKDKVFVAYNDGQKIKNQNIILSGTTYGSQITKASEFEGLVTASLSGNLAAVPVYVFNSGASFVFNSGSLALYSGISRDISGYHVGTELFKNRFISYGTTSSIQDYVSISSNGIITALSGVSLSGSVFATSDMLKQSKSKPITLTTVNIFSDFVPIIDPYIIHSGNTLPLSSINLEVLDSKKSKVKIILNSKNFELNSSAKAELGLERSSNSQVIDMIKFKDSGTLAQFSGSYTHSLTDFPPSSTVKKVDIPFLAIYPTGVSVKIDGRAFDKIYSMANDKVDINLAMLYNNSYSDFSYRLDQADDSIYSILSTGENGLMSLSGTAFTDSTKNVQRSTLSLIYNYDTSVKYDVEVIVTRLPLVRDIRVNETNLSVICLELTSLQSLTAEVFYTNNTSNQKYTWFVDGQPYSGESLELTSVPTSGVVFAESTDLGIDGTLVQTNQITVYKKLADITNAEHINLLTSAGLLSPRLQVKFSPKFSVKLDLGSTFPTGIQAFATINGVRDPGKHLILQNQDKMLTDGLQSNFARKIATYSSKPGLVVGSSGLYSYVSGDYLIRSDNQPIYTGNITSPKGISLLSGHLVLLDEGVASYNKNSSLVNNTLTFSHITPTSGNSFIGFSETSLTKVDLDFSTGMLKINAVSIAPNTAGYKFVFYSPDGKLYYVTDDGLCSYLGSSFSTLKSGDYDLAVSVSSKEFFLTKGRQVFYWHRFTDAYFSIGSIPEYFGNIVNIQNFSSGYVLAVTENGYSIGIAKVDNKTQVVVEHIYNKNVYESIDVEVLAPPQAIDYVIAFDPKNPQVVQEEIFSLSADSFNSNGSSTSLEIEYDILFIEKVDSGFKGIAPGETTVSAGTSELTGTNIIEIRPIVTGLSIACDYIENPARFTPITLGTYMPYRVSVLYSDSTIGTGVYINSPYFEYKDELLYAKQDLDEGTLTFTSIDNDSVSLAVNVSVLPSGDVRVSRFVVEPGPVSLLVGDTHFIDTSVYYTNATSDQFVYTSLDSTNSGLSVVDSNIIEATGVGSATASVKTSTVAKSPAGLVTEKAIQFSSDVTFGKVELVPNQSSPTGLRILNTSGLDGVYFNFTKMKLKPTITSNLDYFFSLETEIDASDGTLLVFKFEPKKIAEKLTPELDVSLSGYTLENSKFRFLINEIKPSLVFSRLLSGAYIDNYYTILSDGSTTVPLDLYLKYDRETRVKLPSDSSISINGVYVEYSKLYGYYLKASDAAINRTTSINGSYTSGNTILNAVASVDIISSVPTRMLFNNEGNPVSEAVASPFYSTDLEVYLADVVGNPVKLEGTIGDLSINSTSANLTVGTIGTLSGSTYYPFTITPIASGSYAVNSSLAYIGNTYDGSLPIKYINTRVKRINLTVENNNSTVPHIVYVDKALPIKVEVGWISGTSIRYDAVKSGFRNPNLLNGEGFNDTNTYSFNQLFDVYLGSNKLSASQYSINNDGPSFGIVFHSSVTSLFSSAKPLSLMVKLKDTSLSSSNKLTIIIQDEPFEIRLVNSSLDRFRTIT